MESRRGRIRAWQDAVLVSTILVLALQCGPSAAAATNSLARKLVGGPDRYRCHPSDEALASLQALPSGISVGAHDYGYHVLHNNVASLPPFLTGGDPLLDRGTIFLPEQDVPPEAYAPYAIGSAGRGRYSVVLNTADIALVAAALFDRPDVTTWALVAHGIGAGALAGQLVASLPGQFTALALLASKIPDNVDLSSSGVGVYAYFGSLDTVVPPSSLADFVSRLPGDAYVAPSVNATHYGFAYSDCLGNTATPTTGNSNKTASVSGPAQQLFQDSLNSVLRFQPWPSATPRALSFGVQSLLSPGGLGSKPYPAGIPRNQVTFRRYPVPNTAPAPPRSWYVFSPDSIKGGLVYFPGAGSPIKGYFPIAFEIAARGYEVVLLQQASRSTTASPDVPSVVSDVNNVIGSDVFQGVQKWAVGGHSRGSQGATIYAALQNATNSKLHAVVLHAGSASANLASSPLPVVLIYGSLDLFFQGYSLSPLFNSATTEVHVVQGANHEQTSDNQGTVVGTISSQEQQSTFAQLTAQFLDQHFLSHLHRHF